MKVTTCCLVPGKIHRNPTTDQEYSTEIMSVCPQCGRKTEYTDSVANALGSSGDDTLKESYKIVQSLIDRPMSTQDELFLDVHAEMNDDIELIIEIMLLRRIIQRRLQDGCWIYSIHPTLKDRLYGTAPAADTQNIGAIEPARTVQEIRNLLGGAAFDGDGADGGALG